MDDATIDAMIRADEARLTVGNSLADELPSSARRHLYSSLGGARASPSSPPRLPRSDAPPLQHLTCSNATERLPEARAEDALVREYAVARRAQYVARVAEEEALGSDSDSDGDADAESAQVRRELRELRDADAYKEELYYLAMAHDAPRTRRLRHVAGGEVVVAEVTTRQYSKITNSILPGPYLTLHSRGRHTRYEALQQRPPVHRSAESIMTQHSLRNKRRSAHYPVPKVAPLETTTEGDIRAVPPVDEGASESAALRRWKQRMDALQWEQ